MKSSNQLYKKSIVIFGVALPLLVAAVILIAVIALANGITKKYEGKKIIYDENQTSITLMKILKSKVDKDADQLKRWDDLMTSETRGSCIEHWKVAEEKFKSTELNKLSHNWVNISDGIGSSAVMPASQVKMSFSGTFRAMQLSLLEFETKLPQLQLDRMTVTSDGNSNQLKFDTVFTLWTP